jgi:hypothetical protein
VLVLASVQFCASTLASPNPSPRFRAVYKQIHELMREENVTEGHELSASATTAEHCGNFVGIFFGACEQSSVSHRERAIAER